jgi:predicted tellurium resistance membrane protein TerC
MIEWLSNPEIWASLLTLTVLEIVLGIDNIIFISIVSSRLPKEKQLLAQRVGLGLALFMRIVLLSMIVWIAGLTASLFTVFGNEFSWRDLILIGGGLFLLVKGTTEIHHHVEGAEDIKDGSAKKAVTFSAVIGQILILDVVFSLDSVITAVGMADDLAVMITAVVIAIAVMMFAADPVSRFVNAHPTVKVLALSFLMLVGMALIADGFDYHIPRGYLYFAVAFSLAVECLNLWTQKRHAKKKLQ